MIVRGKQLLPQEISPRPYFNPALQPSDRPYSPFLARTGVRKIIATTWVSLDGFIAGPKGEMDWVTSLFDDAMGNTRTTS
jgi:hypothetical protein